MPDYILLGFLGRIALDFNNRKSSNDYVRVKDHRRQVILLFFFPDIKSVNLICISFLFYLISCLSSHPFIHLRGLKYVSVNHGRWHDLIKHAVKVLKIHITVQTWRKISRICYVETCPFFRSGSGYSWRCYCCCSWIVMRTNPLTDVLR